jgi:hypothetical protein
MTSDIAAEIPPVPRGAGVLAIASGVAAVALLAAHPEVDAHNFADVLKSEAAGRTVDALVHGGFIAVLSIQFVCYGMLSARLGFGRIASVAGLTFFAFGAAFLSASMLIDGLAVPAIAARYVATPQKIEFARSLFVLMGTLIGLLMPIGLMFQSAAMAAWGWALIASGVSRLAGILGVGMGVVLLGALAWSFAAANPLVLMGAIAATAAWAVIAGAVLLRR